MLAQQLNEPRICPQQIQLRSVTNEAREQHAICECLIKPFEGVIQFSSAGINAGNRERVDLAVCGKAQDFWHESIRLSLAVCAVRSEERRVGKECRSRRSPYH